jgi:hypothetical protein
MRAGRSGFHSGQKHFHRSLQAVPLQRGGNQYCISGKQTHHSAEIPELSSPVQIHDGSKAPAIIFTSNLLCQFENLKILNTGVPQKPPDASSFPTAGTGGGYPTESPEPCSCQLRLLPLHRSSNRKSIVVCSFAYISAIKDVQYCMDVPPI